MKSESVPVSINILGKEYKVSCPPAEREALVRSAKDLNDRMSRMRDTGKIVGAERIAVMTALNVVHENSQQSEERATLVDTVGEDIKRLEDKIRDAIGRRDRAEGLD